MRLISYEPHRKWKLTASERLAGITKPDLFPAQLCLSQALRSYACPIKRSHLTLTASSLRIDLFFLFFNKYLFNIYYVQVTVLDIRH